MEYNFLMSKELYSVVVPVFNSEKTLEELCARITGLFERISTSVEIILVNDGSSDNSWQLIRSLTQRNKGVVVGINLVRNFGQHQALLCGMRQASGSCCILIDDDLQHQPEDIALLIKKQEETGADVVYGIYRDKKHSLLRNAGSKLVGGIFAKYANTPVKGSSFKLITKHILDQIRDHNSPFVYLDELLAWHSRHIDFVEISHEQRREGRSGYSLWGLTKYAFQIIVTYTVLPLRIITWFGLFAFLVCLMFVLYFIYMKYTYGAELGFTALIVSVFMSTGLILFSIGIIGEYISRLFIIQTNKPPFIIKEILK